MRIREYLLILVAICAFENAQACKLSPGTKAATEEDKRTNADLIFLGKIVTVRAAPELEKATRHPHTYLFTMQVEKWEKGQLRPPLLVVDTTGTNCDDQLGIFHLTDQMTQAQLLIKPSLMRRVYVRRKDGHLRVISADKPK